MSKVPYDIATALEEEFADRAARMWRSAAIDVINEKRLKARKAGDLKIEAECNVVLRQLWIENGTMTGEQYDELMALAETAGTQPARPIPCKRGFFAKLLS